MTEQRNTEGPGIAGGDLAERIAATADKIAERFGTVDAPEPGYPTDHAGRPAPARVTRPAAARRTIIMDLPTAEIDEATPDGGQVLAWQSSPLAWSVVRFDSSGDVTEAYVFGGDLGAEFAHRQAARWLGL